MKGAPVILVTASVEKKGIEFSDLSLSLSQRYVQAVRSAGGLPWVIPCLADRGWIAESVRRADGVMLTGGADLEPRLYGPGLSASLRRRLGAISRERDLTELMLLEQIFEQQKPLLAICRGQQILNVALGGDLYADISVQCEGALGHNRGDLKDQKVHEIALQPGSLIQRLFDRDTVGVNSSHHQAVHRVAAPLQVTATSSDGIIEALELRPPYATWLPYLLAVQFHPERLLERYPEFMVLFRSFIQAAQPQSKPIL